MRRRTGPIENEKCRIRRPEEVPREGSGVTSVKMGEELRVCLDDVLDVPVYVLLLHPGDRVFDTSYRSTAVVSDFGAPGTLTSPTYEYFSRDESPGGPEDTGGREAKVK